MIPRYSLRLSTSLLTVFAVACGEGEGAKAPQTHTSSADAAAKYRKAMAREAAKADIRQFDALDGIVSGELESRSSLKPSCEKATCGMTVDLGKDDDGDPWTMGCTISTELGPFGLVLRETLAGGQLDEMPVLQAQAIGEGISATFVANTSHTKNGSVYFGTTKVSVLYAHGYMGLCVDRGPGGRKTFERVSKHFFESLKFKPNPKDGVLFAFGYLERAGDRTSGFRYSNVAKRPNDEPGFLETGVHFWLETDGRTWSAKDGGQVVERDAAGGIEKMQNMAWFDGKAVVLSAKPSEDKKFRLKFEAGQTSNALEQTPKAPLNTELWVAPELLKVSSGASPSYRYAFLDLIDSDPSFHYLTITRSAPGVLLEDQEALTATGKKDSKPTGTSKDELHVDARGLVTKEVSTSSVSELVYTWGTLPSLLTGTATKPTKAK